MDDGDEIELLVDRLGKHRRRDAGRHVQRGTARGRKIAYLHYTYLWPLRTEKLQNLASRSKRIVLVEQNYQGQLGMLIRMECGLDIPDKILKYDGRPFFYDELLSCGDSLRRRGLPSPATGESVSHEGTAVMNTELGSPRRLLRVLLGNQMHLV